MDELRALAAEWRDHAVLSEKESSGMCATAAHLAARLGNLQCLETLIKFGAEINAQAVNGFTPLHHASANGREACVVFLLRSFADRSVQDHQGKTAIEYADLELRKVF